MKRLVLVLVAAAFSGNIFAQDLGAIQKLKDSIEKSMKLFEQEIKQKTAEMKNIRLDDSQKQPGKSGLPAAQQNPAKKIKLPIKNVVLLSKAKPFNGAQLVAFYKKSAASFYSTHKKPEEKKKLDSLFITASPNILNELATAAFLQTKYDAAILYMLKILERDSSNSRAASTLGTFCVTAGVPEKAIPVLEYYIKSRPGDPSLLNNCGQAYLMLGESAKAEQYLKKALQAASWHPEANASMAWISAAKGNKNGAIDYAVRSLESAYNGTAIELLEDLIPDKEEFYKRIPAPVLSVYPQTEDQIALPELEFPTNCLQTDGYVSAVKEAKKPFEEYQKRIAEELGAQVRGLNPADLMNGAIGNSVKDKVFARKEKGQLLIKKAEAEYMEKINRIQQVFNDFYFPKSQALGRELDAARKACSGSENSGECFCTKEMQLKNQFLEELKGAYNIYRNGYWTATRDYTLQLEYWEPIIAGDIPLWQGQLNSFSRKTVLLTTAQQLSGLDISSLQCCDPASFASAPETPISFAKQCRFNLTIPFIIGEFSISCDKVKVKAGEGLVVGYEYEFKSGQTTMMVGPGFNLHEGLVNVDAAAMVYITSDKNGNYIDAGVKGVAEASFMKVGPITGLGAEAEASAGWEAGPSLEISGKVMNQEAFKWK